MAEILAAAGYSVALAARRDALLKEIADSITAAGGRAVAVGADMGVWEQAKRFIDSTVEAFGRLDVLINNAGWGIRSADFDQLSLEEIDQGLAVNLTAVLYGCRAALPVMKRQGAGHIINVSSILGKRSRSGLAVYTACKHGVEGFSRSLMNEVNKHGIKVSILAPAAIRTPWAEKVGIALPGDIRFLEAEDVARAAQCLIETAEHVNLWNLDLISREQSIDPI
jgi:NAD(P)-dependent dehydrogenase (short-subunit alcohol dehydrogenase family)